MIYSMNMRLSASFNLFMLFLMMLFFCSLSIETCGNCGQKIKIHNFRTDVCYNSGPENHSIGTFITLPTTNKPTVVCRNKTSLTVHWKHTPNFCYFVKYTNSKSNEWSCGDWTGCHFMKMKGLHPDQNYSVRLYELSSDNTLFVSQDIWIGTINSTKRTPVENLTSSFDMTSSGVKVTINWRPGYDLSCDYEYVWRSQNLLGEYKQRKIDISKLGSAQIVFNDIDIDRKYFFHIASINRFDNSESINKHLEVLVTCLDAYKSPTECAHVQPKNLRYHMNSTMSNRSNQANHCLRVEWDRPKLNPSYYIMTLKNSSATQKVNISGSQWFFDQKLSPDDCYRRIELVAFSKRGLSKPSIINSCPIQKIADETELPNKEFLEPSIYIVSGVFIGFTIIISAVHRKKIKQAIENIFWQRKIIATAIVKYTVKDEEDNKWELTESKLIVDKIIGVGAFGIVQNGLYQMGPDKRIRVAVKTLKARPTKEQISQFYDEIQIMKSVPRHKHIVYLIGVITKHRPNNPLMLVEFCAHGNLQSFLRRMAFVLEKKNIHSKLEDDPLEYVNERTNFFNKAYDSWLNDANFFLESKDLLSFARQIVLGMEFLASLKVVHRDLAARNILLDENNLLKISDFGLSRDIYTDDVYKKITGGKLPFRWMALESLTHQIYTTKSDVWSFGIVLWEIVTLGGNPYPTVNTEDLVQFLIKGNRMDKPSSCSDDLYEIMLKCWQTSPNLRPSFKDLREVFDKLLESEMQYISLDVTKSDGFNQYVNDDAKNILNGQLLQENRYVVQNSQNIDQKSNEEIRSN